MTWKLAKQLVSPGCDRVKRSLKTQWNLRMNQIVSKKKREGSAAIAFGANLEYQLRPFRSRRVSEHDWQMERRNHFCQ
jgi:hypothetical protein